MSSPELLIALVEVEKSITDFKCAQDVLVIIDKLEKGETLDEYDTDVILDYYDGGPRNE